MNSSTVGYSKTGYGQGGGQAYDQYGNPITGEVCATKRIPCCYRCHMNSIVKEVVLYQSPWHVLCHGTYVRRTRTVDMSVRRTNVTWYDTWFVLLFCIKVIFFSQINFKSISEWVMWQLRDGVNKTVSEISYTLLRWRTKFCPARVTLIFMHC